MKKTFLSAIFLLCLILLAITITTVPIPGQKAIAKNQVITTSTSPTSFDMDKCVDEANNALNVPAGLSFVASPISFMGCTAISFLRDLLVIWIPVVLFGQTN